MNHHAVSCLVFLVIATLHPGLLSAAELISRKTETGTVVGYTDTPMLPWTGNQYCVHDPNRPVPPVVLPRPVGSPLPAAPAPADAIVLFGGKTIEQWKASSWEVKDGVLHAGRESLETQQPFGDCQLHLEFATPAEPSANFMNRGNSGVIIMGKYELQIFDSWHEHPQQIYPDGQAASIYGQTPPLVNACMPPGQWQSYDIVFMAPVFKDDELTQGATVTMYHNGVLVHHAQRVMGAMMHRDISPYKAHAPKLPLVLQGHGSMLRFRNIWIREL